MIVQLRKIIRDLWIYRLRTGLSIFAICAGLVLFGGLATALNVLKQSYEQAFRQSNPAQVTMRISAFESNLLRRIDSIEGVIESDARFTTSNVRIEVTQDEWMSLELHAIDDYNAVKLHRIFPEPGTIDDAPARGSLWLDRSILQRNDLSVGDVVVIQGANGDKNELQIAGFVNDVIAYPSNFSDQAVAYISFETLRDMKMAAFTRPKQPAFNQLYLRFNLSTLDVVAIRDLVDKVQDRLRFHGYRVISTEFLTDAPPLENQTDALDMLLIFSTILSFGVTGVMIANFVSAIVGRQINEIGIMKSLGAVPTQITTFFFIMLIILGLIAFALSLPLTGYFAQVLIVFMVNMFDIDAQQVVVLWNIRLFQFLSALLIPLLAALVPIVQGATLTVRETLRSDGNVTGRFMGWLAFLSRLFISTIIFQIAIRNIFLKPGRFLLTTISLILPGALFIASFGIESALLTLDTRLADSLFSYDIEFSFDGDIPIRLIERIAEKQSGVLYVEAWRQGSVHRIYPQFPGNRPPPPNDGNGNRPPPPNGGNGNRPPPPNGGNGNRPPPPNGGNGNQPPPDFPVNNGQSISGDILLRGVPIESNIIRISHNELTSGRWLQDSNDLLLTYEGYEALSLNVDGSNSILVGYSANNEDEWNIAGVTGQMITAEGFVDIDTFERLIPLVASSIRLAIVTESKDVAEISQVLENLRAAYNKESIDVNASAPIRALIEQRAGRLSIVTQTLITLSMMIGTVSMIGLISTISINIRERTKSIGILRSLGGDYRHLGAMVFIESLTIVLTSYVLAFALSYVVGNQVSIILGNHMYSLDAWYSLEWFGSVVWFVIIVLVGIIGALGPALYAINITISDTLRYTG